uniref:Uncharacterized protein n=1 Tax=Cucumis melo TaxID=3656 RepID=A0A9I9CW23_CUCME
MIRHADAEAVTAYQSVETAMQAATRKNVWRRRYRLYLPNILRQLNPGCIARNNSLGS